MKKRGYETGSNKQLVNNAQHMVGRVVADKGFDGAAGHLSKHGIVSEKNGQRIATEATRILNSKLEKKAPHNNGHNSVAGHHVITHPEADDPTIPKKARTKGGNGHQQHGHGIRHGVPGSKASPHH